MALGDASTKYLNQIKDFWKGENKTKSKYFGRYIIYIYIYIYI